MNTLTLNSYAKVNLYLEVLNKRKDACHNIKTLFERIDLCDKMVFKTLRDKKITVTCDLPSVPRDNSNLAWQAARLLQDTCKSAKGADIRIIKRIPVGSGLGGGSSNAASTLTGLNKLWGLGLKRVELARLAAKLGSDVPFFIYDTPFAFGTGRGDKILPLDILDGVKLWHILVVPKIAVSTPYIYRIWDKKYPKNAIKKERARLTTAGYDVNILISGLKRNDVSLTGDLLYNSLEQVAAGAYPRIKHLKDRLKRLGASAVLMSGSGSAVFALLPSKKEALTLYRRLGPTNSWGRVFVSCTCCARR